MTLVELYSKEGCHLCDVAKGVLAKIQEKEPFELVEIKLREGDALFERFNERVPVVHINKEFAFQYTVTEKAFVSKLRRAAKSG